MKVLLVIMFCALVTGEAPLYKKKNKIEGSYIVSLKSDRDVKTPAAKKEFLLSISREGKLNRQYSKAFSGFSATLSEKDLELIRHLDFVDYVEEDETIQASVEWGLDRIDQHDGGLSGNVYNPKGNGKDVDVYVLDTGINTNHQDFMGRASNDEDFILTPTDGGDCNGHGTHVAGIIAQVAKEATIRGVRVLDCDGTGKTSSVLAGMEFVENYQHRNGKTVVCMSLGGEASGVLDEAVAALHADGIPVIVAAGNDHRDACGFSPARAAKAYTVGATTRHDKAASFTNYGNCVNISAPGKSIESASHTSNSGRVFKSGTSMAAPFVAGVAAIECQVLELDVCDPTEVYNTLTNNATPNKIHDLFFGPNLLLYVESKS